MNLLKNMKLSTKTAITISAMLIVIFIILIIFTIVSTGNAIRTGVNNELRSMSKSNGLQVQRVMDVTQSTSKDIESYMEKQYTKQKQQLGFNQSQSAEGSTSVIYNIPISNSNSDIEKYITETARNAAVNNPDIMGVGVMFEPYKFDKNIESYAFYVSETDKDNEIHPYGTYLYYSKQGYYAKTIQEKEMVFTKPYKCHGVMVVTASAPIIYNDEIKGAIMSDLKISNFSKLETKNECYPSLYTTIIDQNGLLVYDSKASKHTGKNMSQYYSEDEWQQVANKMKKAKPFSMEMTYKGKKEAAFFYPIKAGNTNWWSLMEVEDKDINQKINPTILGLLTISIVALIMIVIATITVLRKMLNPLQNVTKAATEIAKGNFDIYIPVSSKDEIGQLSKSFIYMAKNIKNIQEQLVMKNEQLEETIDKLEKSDAANSAKDIFITNISHEFRTPITLILSTIQLFQMNMINSINEEKANKHLKIMKQNCYRLLRIVNNLIDISRAEAGFNALNVKNIDVVELVSDIAMSISEYAIEKNISVQFITDRKKLEVKIDPDKMERVLLNLLSNSIKFTPVGGEIMIHLFSQDASFIISVKDTGIGIPDDKKDLIFDRFHQVDTTYTRMNEGSGIGLSLVKAFIEMQGGTIDVYSKLGKGSEFIIKLPILVTANEENNQSIRLSKYDEKNIEKLDIEFSDIYIH